MLGTESTHPANAASSSYLTDTWSDLEKHYEGDSWNDPGGPNIYGCLKQLNLLKQKHRHFHVLLSIGGWTYSSNFAAGTNSTEKLRAFATSAVALLKDCGFDGLDVDWEYPQNAQEAQQYTKLLHALRYELDQYAASVSQPAHRFQLSVACPAGPSNYERLDTRGMNQFLDFWNLMWVNVSFPKEVRGLPCADAGSTGLMTMQGRGTRARAIRQTYSPLQETLQ